jgi:hypothetical protein
MRLAKGMLMGIGALALVTSLFNLLAPRAMRATAAALVEVASTGTAPALTVDISKSASQHVELTCGSFSDHCVAGNTSTPYVVPAGQNLVVTSVDISTAGTDGRDTLSILTPLGAARNIWADPNDGFTHSFHFSIQAESWSREALCSLHPVLPISSPTPRS